MLESLLGSKGAELVLIFIAARREGYATEIARFFCKNLSTIQNQLDRLEFGGILSSTVKGRTRLYVLSPAYPFIVPLKDILARALSFYPESVRERLLMVRRRPRRRGKPS